MKEFLNNLAELEQSVKDSKTLAEEVNQTGEMLLAAVRNGNKILLCGNGGSAAEAQHIAAEYVSSLTHDLVRAAIPAVALSTDTSIITAVSNDFTYENIFKRQVEAFGKEGDVLIALSTSGNSKNVIAAIHEAKTKGMKIVGLTRSKGGNMAPLCDICLKIPSENTQRVQELSLLIQHSLVEFIENTLYRK